ncbi:hypothetical protein DAMDJJ_09370 [Cupriavidus necator]|uniref:hypothetical protein n=1 Tax=Cupriavidus necator TaxID=106590 RepID=UPI003F737A1B
MRSRDVEAALLSRCATVAREPMGSALDQREANVFRLAAMVVQSSFPREAARLMQASEHYLVAHPSEQTAGARRGHQRLGDQPCLACATGSATFSGTNEAMPQRIEFHITRRWPLLDQLLQESPWF